MQMFKLVYQFFLEFDLELNKNLKLERAQNELNTEPFMSGLVHL